MCLFCLLDLLHKSFEREFKVINSGDKVETQGKSLSSVSVSFAENAKNFQLTKNMLNQNSFASQSTVALFLSSSQRMKLRFFERRSAIVMDFRQTLITSVCENTNIIRYFAGILLEKLKVVLAPKRKGGRKYLSGFWVCNQLCFLSVTPLFAAIIPFLSFFGRSIGCSLASNTINSKMVSLGCKTFLPGKRNFFDFANASSTFRIVRQTVDSLTP